MSNTSVASQGGVDIGKNASLVLLDPFSYMVATSPVMASISAGSKRLVTSLSQNPGPRFWKKLSRHSILLLP